MKLFYPVRLSFHLNSNPDPIPSEFYLLYGRHLLHGNSRAKKRQAYPKTIHGHNEETFQETMRGVHEENKMQIVQKEHRNEQQ